MADKNDSANRSAFLGPVLLLPGGDEASAQETAHHLRVSLVREDVLVANEGQTPGGPQSESRMCEGHGHDEHMRDARGRGESGHGDRGRGESGHGGREHNESGQPFLLFDAHGVSLVSRGMELRGDFEHMVPRLQAQNLHRELVVRAAKLKGAQGAPWAIDATAGLGEDSLLLAAAGFRVTLYERDPVIAALLRDALARAQSSNDSLLAEAVGRMMLVEGDSIAALENLAQGDSVPASPTGRVEADPDIVLLDPMFPARHKSASVKKKLQLLQTLERPCDDEGRLLSAALGACPRKVLVKRPAKGPYLAGQKPSYSLLGKAIRYDVIVVAR